MPTSRRPAHRSARPSRSAAAVRTSGRNETVSALPPLAMWCLALFAGFVITASLAMFVTDVVSSSDEAVLAVLTGVSALARVGFGLLLDS